MARKTEPGPSYAKLRRHHKRIQAMLDDPECVGDLLAFGLSLAHYVDFDPEFRDRKIENRRPFDSFAAESMETYDGHKDLQYAVQRLLRDDIRRYDPLKENRYGQRRCTAPMIRRDGLCGRSASIQGMIVDLDTGTRTLVGGCNRHREWFETLHRRNREALKAHPAPTPAANSGGVLARHIPEIAWHKVYRRFEPDWMPPPEEKPWQRPQFELLLGDETGDDVLELDGPPRRPTLAVVRGAAEGINIGEAP